MVAALALGAYSWGRGHPQDNPWTRLSLADPIGRFTNYKISRLRNDFAACPVLLDAGGENYVALPPTSRAARANTIDIAGS